VAAGVVQFRPPEGGRSLFLEDGREVPVHRAQIDGGGSQSLTAHDRVEFDLHDSDLGPVMSGVYRV